MKPSFIHAVDEKTSLKDSNANNEPLFPGNNPIIGLQFVIFLLYIICCKTYRYQNLYSITNFTIAFRASKIISNESDEIHLMVKIFGVNNDIYLRFYL